MTSNAAEASFAPPLPGDEAREVRRRRELIEATIASISRFGLSATTVARVAELAGLSTGIVNFYFKSKQALLLATLEYVQQEFHRVHASAREAAEEGPVAELTAMIDAYFDPRVCEPGRVAVWNAFWGEARAREDYLRVCGSRERAEERAVIRAFSEIAACGDYGQLDVTALARAFYHLLSSLPEGLLQEDSGFDVAEAKATCRGFLASVFPAEFADRGIAAEPSAASRVARDDSAATCVETLPGWVYRDPEFYELERELIFRRHWLLVGHTSQVPQVGDYLPFDAVGERAFVIRGRDGVLRAFHNQCRHRASRVVGETQGRCERAIVCPYHGWSYGLDGALRAVPSEASFDQLDKSHRGLQPIALGEWAGFLFLRFAGDGPSVGELLAPLEAEARHFRFPEMKPWTDPYSHDCDFDWKLFAENDAEGYHIPTGHPGLRRLFGNSYIDDEGVGDAARSFSELQAKESSVWSERAYQRLLPVVEHLPEAYRRAWAYYGLFPTSVIQIAPDRVDCYQVLPVAPGRCQVRGFAVALEDERREMRAARYLNSRIVRQVFEEDLDFCRWTDEGVRSSAYAGSVLSTRESGVRQLQDRIRELIPVARLSQRPESGRVRARNEEMLRAG